MFATLITFIACVLIVVILIGFVRTRYLVGEYSIDQQTNKQCRIYDLLTEKGLITYISVPGYQTPYTLNNFNGFKWDLLNNNLNVVGKLHQNALTGKLKLELYTKNGNTYSVIVNDLTKL